MTDSDQVRTFEDERWTTTPQQPVWRHRTACQMVHGEPVLDVGGGDGLLLRMLRERGLKELAMTDLSPVGVERAREAGFDGTIADATLRLPFQDQSFGTVCALDVLEGSEYGFVGAILKRPRTDLGPEVRRASYLNTTRKSFSRERAGATPRVTAARIRPNTLKRDIASIAGSLDADNALYSN